MGGVVFLEAFVQALVAPSCRSASPEVAEVSLTGVDNWGHGILYCVYAVRGRAPGATHLDFEFSDGVAHCSVIVESCDHFPKVAPQTIVFARAGETVQFPVDVITGGLRADYAWYPEPLSYSLNTTFFDDIYATFTPVEAKQYVFSLTVIGPCGEAKGEVVIDASVAPRRHAARH